MELLGYNFICPNCNKEFYTYIERTKYQELITRQKEIRDIFDEYPMSYKDLFLTGFCNICQNKTFDLSNDNYCLETNATNSEDSNLYHKIELLS